MKQWLWIDDPGLDSVTVTKGFRSVDIVASNPTTTEPPSLPTRVTDPFLELPSQQWEVTRIEVDSPEVRRLKAERDLLAIQLQILMQPRVDDPPFDPAEAARQDALDELWKNKHT